MYVMNDIELLCKLYKNKVLDRLPDTYSIGITDLRLNNYSFAVRSYVINLGGINVVSVDDGFGNYSNNMSVKHIALCIGEISSIYYTYCNSTCCIVLSEEDFALREAAKIEKIKAIEIDEFISLAIKDERKLKLYNLIKSVA